MKALVALLVVFTAIARPILAQEESERPEIFINKGIQGEINFYGVANTGKPCLIAVTGVGQTTVHFMRTQDLKEFNRTLLEKIRGVGLGTATDLSLGTNTLGIYRFGLRGNRKRLLLLYDVVTGKRIDSLHTFKEYSTILITPDDQKVIAYNADSIMIYSIEDKKVTSLLGCSKRESGLIISKVLYDGIQDKLVVLYDDGLNGQFVQVMTAKGAVLTSFGGDVDNAFLVDGNKVCLIRSGKMANMYSLSELYTAKNSILAISETALPFPVDNKCKLSVDGKYLFFRKMDKSDRAFTAEMVSNINMKKNGKKKADSLELPSILQDSLVFVLNMASGKVTDSIPMQEDYHFAYDPLSQKIFYESLAKGTIKKITSYNLLTKATVYVPVTEFRSITSVAFSKAAQTLAMQVPSIDNPIQIMNIQSGTLNALASPYSKSEKKAVFNMCYSINGKYLIYHTSTKLFVFEQATKQIRTMTLPLEIFTAVHATSMDSIAIVSTFDKLLRFNLLTGSYQVLSGRIFKNMLEFPLVLNDSIGYYSNVTVFDRHGRELKNQDKFRWEPTDYSIQAINFVSLRSMDTIYRFADTTKHSEMTLYLEKSEDVSYDYANKIVEVIMGDKHFSVDLIHKTHKLPPPLFTFPRFGEQYGISYTNADRYYLKLADGMVYMRNRLTDAIELQMALYGKTDEVLSPLTISKEGNFEGNSSVLRFFFWKNKKTMEWYSYDAFYNSFFTPHLFMKKLNGLLENTLDISFYIRVPGLGDMLKNGYAKIEHDNSLQYLVIKHSNLHSQILGDVPGMEMNDKDKEFPYRIKIPLGTTIKKPELPHAIAADSAFYYKTENKGKLYVCTFGIGNYPARSHLERLPSSIKSANNIEQLFRSNEQQINKVFEKVIFERPLMDSLATRANIIALANKLLRSTKANDCIVFYFIGHGVVPQDSELFYFFPYDGINGTNDEIEMTGVSAATISDLSNFMVANRILIILDACQSGATNQSVAVGQNKEFFASRTSVNLIASSTPYQYSVQDKGASFLSKKLAEGVNRYKKDKKMLTIDDFLKFASDKKLEKDNDTQRPEFFKIGVNFPLFDFRP